MLFSHVTVFWGGRLSFPQNNLLSLSRSAQGQMLRSESICVCPTRFLKIAHFHWLHLSRSFWFPSAPSTQAFWAWITSLHWTSPEWSSCIFPEGSVCSSRGFIVALDVWAHTECAMSWQCWRLQKPNDISQTQSLVSLNTWILVYYSQHKCSQFNKRLNKTSLVFPPG